MRQKAIKKITAIMFSLLIISGFCLESESIIPMVMFGVSAIWMGLVIAANVK